jgi:hypothetical protein
MMKVLVRLLDDESSRLGREKNVDALGKLGIGFLFADHKISGLQKVPWCVCLVLLAMWWKRSEKFYALSSFQFRLVPPLVWVL